MSASSVNCATDLSRVDTISSFNRMIERTTMQRACGDRAEKALGNKFGSGETAKLASETWFDVRAFGQLFALPKKSKAKGQDEDGDTGVSIPIRGPVTIQSAFSLAPVDVTSTQITKSVSGDGDGTKRGSDTMGMKHRIDEAVYVFYGSMNPQLAEHTGFSDADAEAIKGFCRSSSRTMLHPLVRKAAWLFSS